MIVSTILLTRDNYYVGENGKLPARPKHDKELLTSIVKDQYVTDAGFDMLPPSIRELTRSAVANFKEPTTGITIQEINDLTELLIVSRSPKPLYSGKKFRLDNFRLLVEDIQIELWVRK